MPSPLSLAHAPGQESRMPGSPRALENEPDRTPPSLCVICSLLFSMPARFRARPPSCDRPHDRTPNATPGGRNPRYYPHGGRARPRHRLSDTAHEVRTSAPLSGLGETSSAGASRSWQSIAKTTATTSPLHHGMTNMSKRHPSFHVRIAPWSTCGQPSRRCPPPNHSRRCFR
jgi:hypothetical protein